MTALFVQRDTSYHLVRRRLRGSMTRDQWDNPSWRSAAIETAWSAAIEAVRADELEFVMPSPVTLFFSGDALYCADVRLPGGAPQYIYPDGRSMTNPPFTLMCTSRRTTYKTWVEGPLIHIQLTPHTKRLSPDDQRAIDSLPNAALRDRALAAISVTGSSAEAQDAPDMRDVVDFGLRGIFKTKDYTVLTSKQSDQGSKLVLPDGTVWDGRDDEVAPDNLLGD